jgi:hypothetical protein
MDLSKLSWSDQELHLLLGFIRTRKLSYQPFRFSVEHEVGEGMAFLSGTSTKNVKGVVSWPQAPSDIMDLLVRPEARGLFQEANDELRKIYDYLVDHIQQGLGGDLSRLEFAEFGCNTGYFLYRLGQRGALRAVGLDFTNNNEVFRFFNKKLETNAEFMFSEWDSLLHKSHYADVPEVDCCLSVAVLCHLADPLHHLTYLCSKARKAVFVWTPTHNSDDLHMSFGKPAIFPNSLAWPVSFDNLVKPSRGLLELCLKECGFEDLRRLEPIPSRFDEIDFWSHHTGILALRTKNVKTAYAGGLTRRARPPDTIIPEGLVPFSRRIRNWFR